MCLFFKFFFRFRNVFLPFVLLGFLLPVTFGHSSGITDVPEKMRLGFESINAADSYSYLEFIAADELEGRDTPSKGLTIARRYIQSLYKTWGIKPAGDGSNNARSYEQKFAILFKEVADDTCLEVKTHDKVQRFLRGKDFTCSDGADFPGEIRGSVVYAGYGLYAPDMGYDDFAGIDVRGKIVMISAGKPGGDRADSPFNRPENRARFSGRRTPAENCARLLSERGAAALIIIDESQGMRRSPHGYIHGDRISSSSNRVFSPDLAEADPMVPSFWASRRVADAVFSSAEESYSETKAVIDETIRPNSKFFSQTEIRFDLNIVTTSSLTANLLGMIEGSDPELKDEYVVIGAHLDHVGMNEQGYVFNGADDNGSGSVGVLQVAKAFAMNPVKPKRSILFAHWTGEEKGIVGSQYYVKFPALPIEKNVACVNLDMICKNTSLATATGAYDLVVVDCAPTAETLKLLTLPDALRFYTHRVLSPGRALARAVAPLTRHRAPSGAGLPVPDDDVVDAVTEVHGELAGVHALLTDTDRSSVRLVVNPERIVLAEAERTATSLSLFGYGVDAVIVNRILPEHLDHPYLARWRQRHAEHVVAARTAFAPTPVLEVPLLEDEVIGGDALSRLGRLVYADHDPTAVLHPHRPLTIVEDGAATLLVLALPFAVEDDLSLSRRDDDLQVTVGSLRRNVPLPAALRRRAIVGARLDGGALEVRFAAAEVPAVSG
ncbi:MAG: M20/M25/M40 family metallo-hydrolase [Candidatus Aminicenantes bacterium]